MTMNRNISVAKTIFMNNDDINNHDPDDCECHEYELEQVLDQNHYINEHKDDDSDYDHDQEQEQDHRSSIINMMVMIE